ncbi:hypothetical protein GUJ93_ZPchr0002g24744 [Zizania palustris]|uniref:TFA2 Winged helix domain-containing protein n=1 Tax=Zizania palustris TaxID=103762 RepID=A0A8J5VEC6_ZIZPA|nr:hypothetical protein GUJ93_ZPchr0002g24744 [Zizania palustris]
MDKTLVVRGSRIVFSISDVAGDNQFLNHVPIMCKDTVAILYMFDLTSCCMLTNIVYWYERARKWNKSKYDLKGKDQLLVLVRKYLEGLAIVEVKDAYPTVLEYVQALKAAGEVWMLSNMDSQEDIVYPNDPKAKIKVDDDLKQLFQEIELPHGTWWIWFHADNMFNTFQLLMFEYLFVSPFNHNDIS